jgi:hypothetical protein
VTHLGLRGPGLTLPSAGPGPHTGAIGFRIRVHATSTDFCIPYRAKTNEFEHPYVVELAVVSDELDVELSQRIMQFQKSRHIRPRYGRSGSNIIVGVFPIYRSLAFLLNSLAESSASLAFEISTKMTHRRRGAPHRGRVCDSNSKAAGDMGNRRLCLVAP